MNQILVRTIAVGLSVCLFLLGVLVYPQTVAHAEHHVHHKAATHATALCTWMCAAGQTLEAASFGLDIESRPLTFASSPLVRAPGTAVLSSPSTRGPPWLLY